MQLSRGVSAALAFQSERSQWPSPLLQPIVVFDADGRFVTAVLRPAKRPKGVEIRAFLRRLGAGDPRHLAEGRDSAARRQPLRLSAGPRLVRGEWRRLRPRPRPDQYAEAPCRRPGRKHLGTFQGDAGRWQGAPFQGILRRRRQLEPGPPHRRPRRGRQRRHRYPLHRHQPRPRQRPIAVPGPLLPARTGLAADRTSCPKATANQFRLFLHAGAYWLLWSLRALMPRGGSSSSTPSGSA